ncbi:Vi polysaccharide biosynthesis UDP-N-acetylglucosamine C-6 dehydrogenase TviB [Marivirga harenae]|uniref:Vi polysaccharide biosynthesis UDP-N-acetylglucosamine C-6 dehydrogenase TviB n=1 Tax=Marivirga harenae TaxID=2010992 RepID=UPI0026DF1B0B|nr:Vi polysaccharide biosynthesis UDP-N-acetylglucosamine C-6 dehydrogenase TviB [Marivirga harenae]WKV13139.1 Vi polysaccharide biosynthesis UDP-N-acetylglucosamine C-6 dehydrogenase TviB [Marivirga harenae]|tara:strand:- start:284990 stop:286240 length:1251 start_codon:yes stop_codon:yes gene_type:complete
MKKIAVIGLGYVGLPLAAEFGKYREVLGFDVNKRRIQELKDGYDRTLEVESDELKDAKHLQFTAEIEDLKEADYYIITVPTPINEYKQPDLTPLKIASATVGKTLKKGDIVIYESTVYPGCTEDDCVPILEKESGLKFNQDFFCGYSPERINPGDKEHRLPTIKKVTSGSTPEIAEEVDQLYKEIITAGTHKAATIKVAEAAKVIENSQRDLNIAFVNELALIFDKMGIDTADVLEAAGTKWNFLPFKPGLVGGHCIGVDPYYLTHKAESLGYHPQVILSGRRINDNMGAHVASSVVKLMAQQGSVIKGSKVLILGITFKENCPDIRNSKVIDVIKELQSYGIEVETYDPQADKEEVKHEYGVDLFDKPGSDYNAIVLAVSHKEFKDFNLSNRLNENGVTYDIKGFFERGLVNKRL